MFSYPDLGSCFWFCLSDSLLAEKIWVWFLLKLVWFTLELSVIQTGEVVSNDHNSPSTNPATKFITATECFYGSNALQGVRGGRCVTPDTIWAVVVGTKLNTAVLRIPVVRLVQTPLQSMVSQLLEQSLLKLRLFDTELPCLAQWLIVAWNGSIPWDMHGVRTCTSLVRDMYWQSLCCLWESCC